MFAKNLVISCSVNLIVPLTIGPGLYYTRNLINNEGIVDITISSTSSESATLADLDLSSMDETASTIIGDENLDETIEDAPLSLHPPSLLTVSEQKRGRVGEQLQQPRQESAQGGGGARKKEEEGKNTSHNKKKKDRKEAAIKKAQDNAKQVEMMKDLLNAKELEKKVLEEDRRKVLREAKEKEDAIKEKHREAVLLKQKAEKELKKAEEIKAKEGVQGMTKEQYDHLRHHLAPSVDRENAAFGNKFENNPYFPFTRKDLQDLKDSDVVKIDPCKQCEGKKKIEGENKARIENLQMRVKMRESEIKKMNKEIEEKGQEIEEEKKRKCSSDCCSENERKRQKTVDNNHPFIFSHISHRQVVPTSEPQGPMPTVRTEQIRTSDRTASTSGIRPSESLPLQSAAAGAEASTDSGGESINGDRRNFVRDNNFRGKARGRETGSQPNIFYCFRCGIQGHIARNCPQPDPRKLTPRKEKDKRIDSEKVEKKKEKKKEERSVKSRLGLKAKADDSYKEMEIIIGSNSKKLEPFTIPKLSNKARRLAREEKEEEAGAVGGETAKSKEAIAEEENNENNENNDNDDDNEDNIEIELNEEERDDFERNE